MYENPLNIVYYNLKSNSLLYGISNSAAEYVVLYIFPQT